MIASRNVSLKPLKSPTHRWARPRRVAVFASGTRELPPLLDPPAASLHIKQQLVQELSGLDRGIFGITAAKKAVLHGLVAQLEALNPVAAPTEDLSLVEGDWKLLYSTIVISGVKRTKLGLREFIKLGDFTQSINVSDSTAVNSIDFNVSGLGMLKGGLTIRAGYTPSGPQRVDIKFQEATLAPPQLQALFEKNLELLLSVFNPEGHLDITYLDAQHRVGRDDKGNIFVLQRA